MKVPSSQDNLFGAKFSQNSSFSSITSSVLSSTLRFSIYLLSPAFQHRSQDCWYVWAWSCDVTLGPSHCPVDACCSLQQTIILYQMHEFQLLYVNYLVILTCNLYFFISVTILLLYTVFAICVCVQLHSYSDVKIVFCCTK